MTAFRHGSFQTRLSTLVAVAVGVAVALASMVAYLAVSNQLYSGVNKTLNADLKNCSVGTNGIDPSCLVRADRQGGGVAIFDAGGQNITQQVVSLTSPFDQTLYSSGPTITPSRAQLSLASRGGRTTSDATYSGKPYRVMAFPLGGLPIAGDAVVIIAQPLSSTVSTLSDLRLVLILVVLLGIAIAIGFGIVIARAVIRPVKRLTATAEHVAATQSLDATIDEDSRDELGRLAHAFNEMLAALRSSRRQQAQLVSDAGHELRTPLTSLRTNIEFLMRARDMPAADRDNLLTDVQGQLEELTALVGDIVETARQDERQQREYTEVRLEVIVERAVERARRRAPSLTFDVDVTPGSVRAQPALLERAVLNVLDNAAKWSPPAGTVEVRLRRAERWTLEVRDHGPGIAPDDLPRIFDRFYRAPTARSMPGSGLGLAIVSQVVADHGGTVGASVPPGGGTLVRIELAIVDEDEPAAVPPAPAAATDDGWGPPLAPPGWAVEEPDADPAPGQPRAGSTARP